LLISPVIIVIVLQPQIIFSVVDACLQCFDAVGWAAGRASACKWWGDGMVIYLERDADLHMAQLMPLPLTVSCLFKSRLILPSGTGSPG